jgi:hypothetical protein
MCSSIIKQFNAGENISVLHQWINQPNISFALQADGLAIDPINTSINLSLYSLLLRMNIRMQKRFML